MKYFLLLLAILPMQGKSQSGSSEKAILLRMEALLHLQNEILEKAWPGTTGSLFSIPFIYYTDSACYVANPTEKFLQQFKSELKYKTDKITIYKSARIDEAPFHMEVHVSDNPADFNFGFPYGRISGFDETRKYAPELPASQWCGMILHEFFHGYQFRHEPYLQYAYEKKLIYAVINDSLQSYYKNYDWYKKSVDEENDLILKAIGEKKKAARNKLVLKMFTLRDARRKQSAGQVNRPVDFYEQGFETMEGTARYIEDATGTHFSKVKFSDEFMKIDTAFNNAISKPGVNPESAYKTAVSQKYTYAIGFNMARLLDVYGNNYKSRLFKEPGLTLEKILGEEAAKR